jgi:hypothetical protein
MTGAYGDYRSKREDRDWAGAWVAANLLEREGEQEAALRDWWRTADLEAVAGEVVWCGHTSSDVHPALWWLDEGGGWRLRFKEQDGPDLATHRDLDLQPLQKEWARGLALKALDLWEQWASDWIDPNLKGAMRRSLLLHMDGSDQAEAERLGEMMMSLNLRRLEDAVQRSNRFEAGAARLRRLRHNPSDDSSPLARLRTPEAQQALEEADAATVARHAANAIMAVVASTPVIPPRFPERAEARAAAQSLARARACMRGAASHFVQEYQQEWTTLVLGSLRDLRLNP